MLKRRYIEDNFRKYLNDNSDGINKIINTPEGLKLFRDTYYPNINVNFEIDDISSISRDHHRLYKDLDINKRTISILKEKFSLFKSECSNKRVIRPDILAFWSQFLNVSVEDLLSINKLKSVPFADLKDDVYYYIPDNQVITVVSDFEDNLKQLTTKLNYENTTVWPLALHVLSGSILYVCFKVSDRNEVFVSYYMTYYLYTKLFDLIRLFPQNCRTLSYVKNLPNNYPAAKTQFIIKAKESYLEHRCLILYSMIDTKYKAPNLYRTIAETSDYLYRTLILTRLKKNKK